MRVKDSQKSDRLFIEYHLTFSALNGIIYSSTREYPDEKGIITDE